MYTHNRQPFNDDQNYILRDVEIPAGLVPYLLSLVDSTDDADLREGLHPALCIL